MTQPVKYLLPLMNRVLIKKAEAATQTKTGVVVPQGARGRHSRGVVVAVGPGSTTGQGKWIPCCLKVGDVVLLPDYGGTRVEYDDKSEYLLYREYDILAKICDETKPV